MKVLKNLKSKGSSLIVLPNYSKKYESSLKSVCSGCKCPSKNPFLSGVQHTTLHFTSK